MSPVLPYFLMLTLFQVWQEAGCVRRHRGAERLQLCYGFRPILARPLRALLPNGHGSDRLLHCFVCARFVLFMSFVSVTHTSVQLPKAASSPQVQRSWLAPAEFSSAACVCLVSAL